MEPVYDYEKLSTRTDEEMALHADLKERRLAEVFKLAKPNLEKDQLLVAILGCPDHRLISYYATSFQKLLSKPCAIVIFDKVISHLQKMATVIEHDVTQPFPIKPFDIVYSHVLLKFIKKDEQYKVLQNSYDALVPGGMAIHFLDEEDITTTSEHLPDGWYSVSLVEHEAKLAEQGIKFMEVPVNLEEFVPEKHKKTVHSVRTVGLVLIK